MAPIPQGEYCGRIREEGRSGGFWRDLFSEFLANFLFVTLSTLMKMNTNYDTLHIAIGVTFLWTAIGYGLCDFGGSHMNSAITMAMMIRAEITIIKATFYWILQVAGALAGYYFTMALTDNDANPPAIPYYRATFPGDRWWQSMIIEAVITLVLCLAALGTGNIPRKGYIILQSIPIAFAAGIGTLVAFAKTGACMNPTQALARQIMVTIEEESGKSEWDDHWLYWAGPMIGAVAAAIFYWIFDVIDRPMTGGMYNTWTYADAKSKPAKSSSKERLTNGRQDDDDTMQAPPHHAYHGYGRY